jgi:hypothetical protein
VNQACWLDHVHACPSSGCVVTCPAVPTSDNCWMTGQSCLSGVSRLSRTNASSCCTRTPPIRAAKPAPPVANQLLQGLAVSSTCRFIEPSSLLSMAWPTPSAPSPSFRVRELLMHLANRAGAPSLTTACTALQVLASGLSSR